MTNFIEATKIELKKRTPEELVDKITELATDNIVKDKEIKRLNKVINDLREYMLDIDYKMGWQYAEYLDELLGIKSNYKKYGIAIDLKEEGK